MRPLPIAWTKGPGPSPSSRAGSRKRSGPGRRRTSRKGQEGDDENETDSTCGGTGHRRGGHRMQRLGRRRPICSKRGMISGRCRSC